MTNNTEQAPFPELDRFSGSWMLTRLSDGEVIETFSRGTALMAHHSGQFKVQTAKQYLEEFNRSVGNATRTN